MYADDTNVLVAGTGSSDCLMFHMAQKAGHLPLGTFDRALAKVHGTQKL